MTFIYDSIGASWTGVALRPPPAAERRDEVNQDAAENDGEDDERKYAFDGHGHGYPGYPPCRSFPTRWSSSRLSGIRLTRSKVKYRRPRLALRRALSASAPSTRASCVRSVPSISPYVNCGFPSTAFMRFPYSRSASTVIETGPIRQLGFIIPTQCFDDRQNPLQDLAGFYVSPAFRMWVSHPRPSCSSSCCRSSG